MIVYNETFIVEDSTVPEWFNWAKTEHIPAIMATGHFDTHTILTVLDSPNEGITYCLQFHTDSIERYSEFHYKEKQKRHDILTELFHERYVLFTTLMETVE